MATQFRGFASSQRGSPSVSRANGAYSKTGGANSNSGGSKSNFSQGDSTPSGSISARAQQFGGSAPARFGTTAASKSASALNKGLVGAPKDQPNTNSPFGRAPKSSNASELTKPPVTTSPTPPKFGSAARTTPPMPSKPISSSPFTNANKNPASNSPSNNPKSAFSSLSKASSSSALPTRQPTYSSATVGKTATPSGALLKNPTPVTGSPSSSTNRLATPNTYKPSTWNSNSSITTPNVSDSNNTAKSPKVAPTPGPKPSLLSSPSSPKPAVTKATPLGNASATTPSGNVSATTPSGNVSATTPSGNFSATSGNTTSVNASATSGNTTSVNASSSKASAATLGASSTSAPSELLPTVKPLSNSIKKEETALGPKEASPPASSTTTVAKLVSPLSPRKEATSPTSPPKRSAPEETLSSDEYENGGEDEYSKLPDIDFNLPKTSLEKIPSNPEDEYAQLPSFREREERDEYNNEDDSSHNLRQMNKMEKEIARMSRIPDFSSKDIEEYIKSEMLKNPPKKTKGLGSFLKNFKKDKKEEEKKEIERLKNLGITQQYDNLVQQHKATKKEKKEKKGILLSAEQKKQKKIDTKKEIERLKNLGITQQYDNLVSQHKTTKKQDKNQPEPTTIPEIQKRLESLKIQIEGLEKLSSYYADDPVASAAAETNKQQLEKEIQDLTSKLNELASASPSNPLKQSATELIAIQDDTPLASITTRDFDPDDAFDISDTEVPVIVADSIKGVLPEINVEGIFRESANASHLKLLNQKYEKAPTCAFNIRAYTSDVHTIAGLLKSYFRSMNPPILRPSSGFTSAEEMTDSEERNQALKQELQLQLSEKPGHKKLLYFVLSFLYLVTTYETENLMSSKNLSVCWAPTFFGGGGMTGITSLLIENYPWLFDGFD